MVGTVGSSFNLFFNLFAFLYVLHKVNNLGYVLILAPKSAAYTGTFI